MPEIRIQLPPEIIELLRQAGALDERFIHRTFDDYKSSAKLPNDQRPTICFTGIEVQRRFELKSIAESHGLRVVTAVPKSLKYLVIGRTAGPAKVAKAVQEKISIMTEPQFMELVDRIRAEGI